MLKRKRVHSNVARGVKRTARRRRLPFIARGPYPDNMLVRMKYTTEVSLNPPNSGIANHIFSFNGLYDPDITGVGHQPYGFDEWMALYNHYCVVASTCSMWPRSQGSPDAYFVIRLTPDSTPAGVTLSEITEQTPLQWGANQASLYYGGVPLKAPWHSTRNIFRVKDPIAKDSLSGDAGTNPADQQYWICTVASANGEDAPSFVLHVEIEYSVKFYERRLLPQS